MRWIYNRRVLLVIFVCAALVVVQGCTLHFKASEVELESHSNVTYELDRVALLDE